VIDLDYKNLTMGVEKRLDEIFADDLKKHNPKISKFQYFEKPSLANLKSTIMSLEWEVNDDNLDDLIQEIRKLQKAYVKNDQLQKLFRLLFHLGRYIKIHKGDTHPYIFKLLFRFYNSSAKIASGKYSNHEKHKIVNNEIKHYLSLKSYLKRENKNIFRRSLKKANTLEKNLLSSIDSIDKQKPYQSEDNIKISYKNLDNDLRELKKFIYLEIKKLRLDLRRIMALIPKKA
jgi:hypothetical protein